MKIPEVLRKNEFRFAKIKEGEKILRENWSTSNNYRWDDEELQEHIENGGNVGLVGGFGDVIILDVDDYDVQVAVEKKLPETLEILSGSGNVNFVFRCKDDVGVIKSEEEGKEYFSIRGKGGQALVPPSVHPESGRRYEINNNRPIAEVSLFQLEKVLNEWWKGKTPRYKTDLERRRGGGKKQCMFFPCSIFQNGGM